MAQRLNKPPVLEYEDHYAKRKNDLDVWQLYGDLNKKKRGPAVYLTLSGRARECISTWKLLSNSRARPLSVDLLFYQQTPPLQGESQQLLR